MTFNIRQNNPKLDLLMKNSHTLPSPEELTEFLELLTSEKTLFFKEPFENKIQELSNSYLTYERTGYSWSNLSHDLEDYCLTQLPGIRLIPSNDLIFDSTKEYPLSNHSVTKVPLFAETKKDFILKWDQIPPANRFHSGFHGDTISSLSNAYNYTSAIDQFISNISNSLNIELFNVIEKKNLLHKTTESELNQAIIECKKRYPNDTYFCFLSKPLYSYIKEFFHIAQYQDTYIFNTQGYLDSTQQLKSCVLAASQIGIGVNIQYAHAWEKIARKYKAYLAGYVTYDVELLTHPEDIKINLNKPIPTNMRLFADD